MSGSRLLPLVLLTTGCGRLADADYRGELLFELSGSVLTEQGLDYRDEDLRVSLFWSQEDGAAEEQDVVLKTSFPAQYTLEIYAWPPPSAMFAAPWDTQHEYAVGAPLLYLDHNHNQRWDEPSEPLVGGALEMAVVYAAPSASPATTGPMPELDLIESGFQRMWSQFAVNACSSPADQLIGMFPAEDEPTNIVVGDWWVQMEDWNCDGDYEWEELCPEEGPDLEAWCEEVVVYGVPPDEPCAELCLGEPGTPY